MWKLIDCLLWRSSYCYDLDSQRSNRTFQVQRMCSLCLPHNLIAALAAFLRTVDFTDPLFVIQYLKADPFVIALVMLTCAGCHSILWHLSCKLQIEAGYQTVEICIISFCIICFHISLSSLYIAEIFQSYVFILSAKVLVVTYK